MRYFAISTVIFLVILCLAFLSGWYLERNIGKSESLLCQSAELQQQGKPNDAMQLLYASEDHWSERIRAYKVFLNHDQVDAITNQFHRLHICMPHLQEEDLFCQTIELQQMLSDIH